MPYVSLLKGRELRKYLFDLHLKILLHPLDPPKASSKYNIFAYTIEAIHMYLIQNTQKSIGQIILLILVIPEKNSKLDLLGYKLQSHFFYWNGYWIAASSNHTMRISDLIKLFLCYGLQRFHWSLFVQYVYIVPQKFVKG